MARENACLDLERSASTRLGIENWEARHGARFRPGCSMAEYDDGHEGVRASRFTVAGRSPVQGGVAES